MSGDVEPVQVHPPMHPGAGSDPNDFAGFFEAGPAGDFGEYTMVAELVIESDQRSPVSGTLNLNLDLNKAFADVADWLRSSADAREASANWDFDVDEVLVTLSAGAGYPQSGSDGSASLSLVMVNYMKDGSVWIDTDRDMKPDLHVIQNSAKEWWADRDMDGKADTLVGHGDYFFAY